MTESCKNCRKYDKKGRSCPIMFGVKQAWEWCTEYVRKSL